MPDLIDCHCHLDFAAFDSDRPEVLARARANGVRHIIIPGVTRDNWDTVRRICERSADLHACYGLHPYFTDEHNDEDLAQLRDRVNDGDCVAIGECGLDYRRGQADRDVQMKFFSAQLDIARACRKPVVIHSVRATEDVISAIKDRPGLRGMIHSFSGSRQQAEQLIGLGFYISLGGAITHDRARKIRATAGKLPLESILLETDAPDQPDADHVRQRNEPAYLVNVLRCLSALRDEPEALIARQTTANARALFRI